MSGISALVGRGRDPEAIVMDRVTYFTILAQGTDAAGFWMSPNNNPGFSRDAAGRLLFQGVPILYDINFNANTGTTKAAIAAEWSQFRFYRGAEFRIDTSDVAGTRWDYNLVGFRGEEEIGFNAYPAIQTGAAQLLVNIIP